MKITPDEADAALETVRKTTTQTRRSIALGGGQHILVAWGLVWLIGFGGSHFLEGPKIGLLWAVADMLGVFATVLILRRASRHVYNPEGSRILLLWLALLLYSALWLFIARPTSGLEIGLRITTYAMFGYVLMGIWLDRTLLWLGLAITALAVCGAYMVPQVFGLWMAVLGGGALLGTGLYIGRRWE